MKIQRRIVLLGVFSPIVPVIVVLALVFFQKQSLATKLGDIMDDEIRDELTTVAGNVYSLSRIQDDSVQQTLRADLNVARDILQTARDAMEKAREGSESVSRVVDAIKSISGSTVEDSRWWPRR